MTKNKLFLIPVAAVSAAMAIGSIAYACTAVQGTTTITSLGGTAVSCSTDPNPQPSTTSCQINVSATGATARQVIAYGTGAAANKNYYLTFLNRVSDQDGMNICMADILGSHDHLDMWNTQAGTAASTVPSDGSGNIASTTRYIPSDVHTSILTNHKAHNGTASVCWVTGNASDGTNDATILITGGSA